jgi:hypothetical protein
MHESTCIGCTQTDTDPKHIVDTNGVNVIWHHDCHAIVAGCAVCKALLAEAPKGAKGEALREHLVALPQRQWTHAEDGSVSVENVED